jgi:ankyrin repeat protein
MIVFAAHCMGRVINPGKRRYDRRMKVLLLLGLTVVSLRAQRSVEALFTQALVAGDLKTAESLLSGGLNPDFRDLYGQTPLMIAAAFGDNKTASLLLSYHADPNAGPKRQAGVEQIAGTPLQCAARTGNLDMAGMLVKAGAQVDGTGAAGRTPLSFAVFFNHLDMIRFLIEKGADVNVRNAEGATPLDDAAWRGFLDAVAMLLAHGARLNEADTQTGATPINEAAYRGNTAVIQYLLQFHPNLEIRDNKGYGPLENAIRMGMEDSALSLFGPEARSRRTLWRWRSRETSRDWFERFCSAERSGPDRCLPGSRLWTWLPRAARPKSSRSYWRVAPMPMA